MAVLLNKCNLDLAPRWAGRPPVNPENRKRIGGAETWRGTYGLAADVRYYGRLVREVIRRPCENFQTILRSCAIALLIFQSRGRFVQPPFTPCAPTISPTAKP